MTVDAVVNNVFFKIKGVVTYGKRIRVFIGFIY